MGRRRPPTASSWPGRDCVNAPDVTGDDVLTLEEAATLFKLSPEAIQTAVESGHLPGRRFGKDWRFPITNKFRHLFD